MPKTTPPGPNQTGFRQALRGANLRVTSVRLSILNVLSQARRALDAQRVYEAVEASSKRSAPDRVTVYRTLNSLVDAGLAHKVDPGDRVFRFSLTDHARCTEHKHVHEHPHFVCDSCGTVECLDEEQVVVKRRSANPKGSARSTPKRKLRQDGVVLHGTCGDCNDEPQPKRPAA